MTMDCDFLIVGGGVAGLSAAAELADLGSVLLTEAEAVFARHASGRSAALYEPNYGRPPVVALSLASGPSFQALPGVLSPRGMLLVARADQARAFDRDVADMDLTPVPVEQARARLPILNPATVAHAAIADHAWDIDTDLFLRTCQRRARAAGARLMTRAAVTALSRTARGWQADTAQGSITARVVVNAAGPWADAVAGLAGLAPLGIRPLRRSMARIPAPAGQDPARWPMVFGCGESWYMKPDAGALIVSPADEDPAEPHDAWPDDMVLAEGLARYQEMVTEPVTRLIAAWAGLRSFAPDRVPVLGPDPADPAFVWCAGQGGYGFQTAPAAARLLADLVAGRAPALDPATVAALTPGRLR